MIRSCVYSVRKSIAVQYVEPNLSLLNQFTKALGEKEDGKRYY